MGDKKALARYFAEEEKSYDAGEVISFLRQVGEANNKRDIVENAEAFGNHLSLVAGFGN